MKVKVRVSLGLVGCKREKVVEFDDDASDIEIEETLREDVFTNMVNWGWQKVEEVA